ncbi:hypothetical protein TELCIR_16745, partial [Teladorsagia circumcincta]
KCGKPMTLNSTGSRIKSNVISHACQTNHRIDDAHDIMLWQRRQMLKPLWAITDAQGAVSLVEGELEELV